MPKNLAYKRMLKELMNLEGSFGPQTSNLDEIKGM
jgi:hypothetical protein